MAPPGCRPLSHPGHSRLPGRKLPPTVARRGRARAVTHPARCGGAGRSFRRPPAPPPAGGGASLRPPGVRAPRGALGAPPRAAGPPPPVLADVAVVLPELPPVLSDVLPVLSHLL